MTLIVREAREEDAFSIAAIRYAAYSPQPGHAEAYGRVPFSDHVRCDGFNNRQFIAASSSLKAKVLVVEDTDTNEIVSTAKWFLPVGEGETVKHPSSLKKIYPDWIYFQVELMQAYGSLIGEVEQSTWKGKHCYDVKAPAFDDCLHRVWPDQEYDEFGEMPNQTSLVLETVTTLPQAQRRGAASLLLQWGIKRAAEDGLPIYLLSEPLGHALYKRLGFVDIEGQTIRIPLASYGGQGEWVIVPMVKEP